jgi:hypothetical protein
MMAEYHMTLPQAVWSPLAAILSLLPSRAERLGHESTGPTDAQEAYVTARNATFAYLRRRYAVQPRRRRAGPAKRDRRAEK